MNTHSSNYQRIWETVARIPKGKVATYGQIARASRLHRQARLVGYALHNLPLGLEIPWQRVINSRGRISFPPRSLSYKRQREMLEAEGVILSKGRVDLNTFGWRK